METNNKAALEYAQQITDALCSEGATGVSMPRKTLRSYLNSAFVAGGSDRDAWKRTAEIAVLRIVIDDDNPRYPINGDSLLEKFYAQALQELKERNEEEIDVQ